MLEKYLQETARVQILIDGYNNNNNNNNNKNNNNNNNDNKMTSYFLYLISNTKTLQQICRKLTATL